MDQQPVSQIFERGSLPFLLVATLSVYLSTLAPTIPLADSPELVAAAFTLGVAHPPGYGLYLLVGKLFSFIPLGPVAWRLNLMAAVLASLASVTFYLALRQLGSAIGRKGGPAGVSSGLVPWTMAGVLALSPTFWASAVGAEVYPFHALLFSLLVLSLLDWHGSLRAFPLSFFVGGLGVALHTANLIFLGALALLQIGSHLRLGKGEHGFRLFSPRRPVSWLMGFTLSLLFLLLGLSAVIYLPVRSAVNPSVHMGEIVGVGDLYQVLTGRIYQNELPSFGIPWGERWFNVKYALLSLGHEFGWSLGLLGLLGTGIVGRRAPLLLLFLLLVSVLNLVFFSSSDLGASAGGRFPFPSHLFLPFYITSALLIGAGLLEAMDWLARRSFLRSGFGLALPCLLLLLPLSFLLNGYPIHNYSESYGYYERGKRLLGSLEDGSVLLCSNSENILFFFWYLNTVEGRWPAMTTLIVNPFLANPLERLLRDPRNRAALECLKGREFRSRREFHLAIIDALIQAHIDRAPFYTNLPEEYLKKEYVKIPRGGIYRIQQGLDLKEVLVEGPWIAERVGVSYGGAIELLGITLDREALEAGDYFRITYFWRASQELKKDYQVAVLITDKKGEVIKMPFAQPLSHAPVYGALPTSRWPKEKVIKESYEFVSSASRLEAGEYRINIGVADDKELLPVTESRVPMEGRFAQVGRFEVLP